METKCRNPLSFSQSRGALKAGHTRGSLPHSVSIVVFIECVCYGMMLSGLNMFILSDDTGG